MHDPHYTPVRYRLLMLLAAVGIGIGAVALTLYWHQRLTGHQVNLSDEWGVLKFQAAWTAIPFALLAVIGVRKLLPWLLGLVPTCAFWGYDLYDSVAYSGEGTGANIGLGLIFLVMPFVLTPLCLGTAIYAERRETRRRSG